MKQKVSKTSKDMNSTMTKVTGCGLLKGGQFSEGIWFKKNCPFPIDYGLGNMHSYIYIYIYIFKQYSIDIVINQYVYVCIDISIEYLNKQKFFSYQYFLY
jgi:hypothetical protein